MTQKLLTNFKFFGLALFLIFSASSVQALKSTETARAAGCTASCPDGTSCSASFAGDVSCGCDGEWGQQAQCSRGTSKPNTGASDRVNAGTRDGCEATCTDGTSCTGNRTCTCYAASPMADCK